MWPFVVPTTTVPPPPCPLLPSYSKFGSACQVLPLPAGFCLPGWWTDRQAWKRREKEKRRKGKRKHRQHHLPHPNSLLSPLTWAEQTDLLLFPMCCGSCLDLFSFMPAAFLPAISFSPLTLSTTLQFFFPNCPSHSQAGPFSCCWPSGTARGFSAIFSPAPCLPLSLTKFCGLLVVSCLGWWWAWWDICCLAVMFRHFKDIACFFGGTSCAHGQPSLLLPCFYFALCVH